MNLKWILLAVFFLAVVVNYEVNAEIESHPELWTSRNKDYRSKVGKLGAWDELLKEYYLDEINSEERDTESEFYYSHVWPKADELGTQGLHCVPGRTIIRLEEMEPEPLVVASSGEGDEDITRRSHMNSKIPELYCKVCVCTVRGDNEYCSGRPAMNVNECIRMKKLKEEFNSNGPYEHSRTLAYRIRRDYIWHNDEIPYEAKAKCRRGSSYYSNSITANDTDIDVGSDVNSILDYTNTSICFYCVCSVDGRGVGCIHRQEWFCAYYRDSRDPVYARDTYKKLFQQDRPQYFRQLSWRLRRTMDEGLYDFESAVGGDDDAKESACVPFVSEYTDCTSENQCNGCNKCLCITGGHWSCQRVQKCSPEEAEDIDYHTINNAFFEIQNSLVNYDRVEASPSKTPYVPQPPKIEREQDLLLDDFREKDYDFDIATLLRNKRSVDNINSTDGIKFYNTVDEINEDTLKSGNVSGTLQAQKVGGANSPKISRRTGVFSSDNVSESSLQIAYNEPNAYDPHLADNKIDAVHQDDHFDTLSRNRMQTVIGNHTQKQKDKELSKLVVNELKSGKEIIGDKNAEIMSNITFTPENDTLTAMAFIAGNLLNKLWNMEKDSGEDSTETEVLKHEKIADLLDLFKEPLNLRQENFLKNALEQLSEAIDKDRNLKNVSLCEKIEETKNILRSVNSSREETTTEKKDYNDDKPNKKENRPDKNFEVVTEAISKINNVLNLINKFQKVQKNLSNLKRKSSESIESHNRKEEQEAEVPKKKKLSHDELSSLNVFGTILEKITKLLMPPKRSKKIAKVIRNQNVLKNSKDIPKELKNLYNIDIDSSNLSPKDKLVFDYLSTVKRNPNCILENLRDSNQSPMTKTEGNILLNLSEFFKVKSFIDLLKLLQPEPKSHIRTKGDATVKKSEITTEITTTTISTTTAASKKLSETKEKLKAHLKSIIDDLIEIQNAKGHPTNNISIVDALPCIYKILNADKNTQDELLNTKTTTVSSPVDKISAIFNSLKQELLTTQNRRSNVITGERPKSAVVWERIIKNFDDKKKQNTRRNLDIKEPKTFDELKKRIDQTDSGSKTYKNEAIIKGVPPSERIVVLKTLFADVKQYINVLEDVDNSMTNWESLSADEKIDLKDYIDNTATNIRLNDRIVKTMNNVKVKSNTLRDIESKKGKKPKENYIQKQSMRLLDVNPSHERNNIKLSRDSIINQLIKNRMQLFIKIKESSNTDLDNDVNYSIAKKILSHLEIGNYALARELYKVIVSQKQKTVAVPNDRLSVSSSAKKSYLAKEPVVQFEEPRGQSQLQWLHQDIWLKQLSNLKNMRA